MTTSNAVVTLGITWTPPGASVNSGNSSSSITASYNGQDVGQIDVPTTYVPPAPLAVPFGNISAAKVLVIKNMMSVEVGVRLNAAVANNFNLAPGAEFAYVAPAAPVAIPITAVTLLPVSAPLISTETILFWVLGD